jgi:predicted ATP-grasp superfamily ATP-dependent carboligase
MATILVTDGEHRAALAVVRSLGKAGHRVLVASNRTATLSGASRHAAGAFQIPDSLTQPLACASRLAEICHEQGAEVAIPVADQTLLAVLENATGFAGVSVPWPDLETVRRVADKALLTNLAPQLGIATPIQHRLERADAATVHDRLRFPLVVKPSRSVARDGGDIYKLSVRHASNPSELAAIINSYPAAAFPLLLQERIVGAGVGVFLLVWNGRLLARFAHRRIREKPPSGGVSVYCESIAMPPPLEASSCQLLERLGWNGVAMVEFKVDQASGQPYLMEINGRFWGSLQLAVDSGVDFPRLLVAAARGENPPPVLEYRTGVRSRWWWGDVDHLLARLRRSNAELALPPGAPGRARALLDFLTLWRPGDRNEVLRWDDPHPFFQETRDWFRGR